MNWLYARVYHLSWSFILTNIGIRAENSVSKGTGSLLPEKKKCYREKKRLREPGTLEPRMSFETSPRLSVNFGSSAQRPGFWAQMCLSTVLFFRFSASHLQDRLHESNLMAVLNIHRSQETCHMDLEQLQEQCCKWVAVVFHWTDVDADGPGKHLVPIQEVEHPFHLQSRTKTKSPCCCSCHACFPAYPRSCRQHATPSI